MRVEVPARSAGQEGAGGATPESAAEYIADLSGELAKIARGSQLDLLAYLLEMAQLEASTAARRSKGSAGPGRAGFRG